MSGEEGLPVSAAADRGTERAGVALALIRDEVSGLELAERLGMTGAEALDLRDRLVRAAPAILAGALETCERRIKEQTAELASLARIAEEYRTGRRVRPRRAAVLEHLAELPGSAGKALTDLRSWTARQLPMPLRSRLRSVLARATHS